jgi:hypothetical protein
MFHRTRPPRRRRPPRHDASRRLGDRRQRARHRPAPPALPGRRPGRCPGACIDCALALRHRGLLGRDPSVRRDRSSTSTCSATPPLPDAPRRRLCLAERLEALLGRLRAVPGLPRLRLPRHPARVVTEMVLRTIVTTCASSRTLPPFFGRACFAAVPRERGRCPLGIAGWLRRSLPRPRRWRLGVDRWTRKPRLTCSRRWTDATPGGCRPRDLRAHVDIAEPDAGVRRHHDERRGALNIIVGEAARSPPSPGARPLRIRPSVDASRARPRLTGSLPPTTTTCPSRPRLPTAWRWRSSTRPTPLEPIAQSF